MKMVWRVFAACAFLCMAASFARAQGAALSVRRSDGVGEAVSAWAKSEDQLYLFLPAYMEGAMLTVACEGMDGVRMGEMVFEDGAQTDALCRGAELTALSGGEEGAAVQVMNSANLPAVHLATESGSLDAIHEKKGNKEPGRMTIVTAGGETAYDAPVESIKGHGNATFVYEKKSYQVKLEKKAALLGMDEGKTYVLLANQHENALLRNRMTFDLARGLNLRFTPECRSVDLYVNGEYRGGYLLCDKVSVSSGSVDVADSEDAIERANEAFIERGGRPEAYGESAYAKGTRKGVSWPGEPQDVTGGYLFELEYSQRYPDEPSGVVTARGQAVVVKSPEEMSEAQGEYAGALLNQFERAIFSEDGADPETGKRYGELADMHSFVRKYMIEEVSKNYDGNKSSQYFYKDSDSVDPLLYAGPVWDYDSAWGNYARKEKPEDASPQGLRIAREGHAYSWWPAMYAQQDFARAVRSAYDSELRALLQVLIGEREPWAGCAVMPLDSYAQELAASAEMNFARWRVLNHSTRAIRTGESYAENIAYLKDWIAKRMAYLDEHW